MPTRHHLLVLGILLTAGPAIRGQEARLATEARLDVRLEGGGTLESGGMLQTEATGSNVLTPQGNCQRMNWVSEEERPRGYTITFPIVHFAESRCTVRMEPTQPGELIVSLMGQWSQQRPGVPYREEVSWTGFEVEGATLIGDPFEPVVTWHDGRRDLRLRVTTAPVTISLRATAVLPSGTEVLQPIADRDTPAHRAARRFQRGVNLGNGLEVPPGHNWGVQFTRQDLANIHAEGFDHIRIPIGWHHYAGPGPEYRLQPAIFAQVDELVDGAEESDLSVMINIHHFDAFTSDPVGQRPQLLAIWRQLAEHYRDRGDSVAFEILNEPKDAATTEVMNDVYTEVLPVIRRISPERTVFVATGSWNSINELPRLRIPADDTNLIVAVHCYDPFLFTHQGASWTMPTTKVMGIQFPGPPERPLDLSAWTDLTEQAVTFVEQYNTLPTPQNPSSPQVIDRLLQLAGLWQEYSGRPVHLGEFGAVIEADPASRARFYRAYRESLDRYRLGWAIWEWKAGFRYWDPDTDRPMSGLHEALRPGEPR